MRSGPHTGTSVFLPPDAQPLIRQQFRRLIEARISAYDRRFDAASADRELKVVSETQEEIWSQAVAATAASLIKFAIRQGLVSG